MSTIKQNIPTFLNGISQQPDKKKIPTQLKDAINTYPDYALGMLKRPGGKFISNLYNAEDISTTISSATHNGTGHASRTVNRYISAATTGGTGTGATFNVHAIAAGEVNTFTHNGVSATNRTAGTYYILNAGGSASGTGADFKVIVDSKGRPNVTLDNRAGRTGGAGYVDDETITIADSNLGNGGAAALVITVTDVHDAVGISVSLSSGGKGYLKGDTLTIADAALGGGGAPAITVTVASVGTYGKWFSILRDEEEKYIGQYADDTFRIWSLTNGSLRKVSMGTDDGNANTGVPSGCTYANMQTDVVAYNNAIQETSDQTVDLNKKQSAFAEATDGQNNTQTSLWETSLDYDTGIGTVSESLVSGISQHETNNAYRIIKNNDLVSSSNNELSSPVTKLERIATGNTYSDHVGLGKVDQIQITAAGTSYVAAAANATSVASGNGAGLTLKTTASAGSITSIEIVAAGTGYQVGDVVTLTGGGGNATATIDKVIPGAVNTLSLTAGGTGYSNGTGVATTVSPAGGVGLTLNTTQTGGVLTAVTVNRPGSGYTINDVITVTGGGGNSTWAVTKLGTDTTTTGDGSGLTLDISTNTSNNVEPEASVSETTTIATFTHNGVANSSRTPGTYTGVTGTSNRAGSGATFDISVSGDGTPTVTLVNGGNAYNTSETITIVDGSLGGGGAASIVITVATTSITQSSGGLTATSGYKIDDVVAVTNTANSGVVTLGTITSGGTGYTGATGVATTVSPAGGTGLTVNTTVSGGVVTGVAVNNDGSGYSVGDVITISGGGANATVPVATIHEATFKVTELSWKKGKEMTSEHPTLASTGLKLYELIESQPKTHTEASLSTTESAMATTQTAYNTAVTAEGTAKGNYDTEVTNCLIPGLLDDGYLRGATADDIELVTLNDYTYVLNKNKTVAFTTDTTNPTSTDGFIVIAITSYNSKYEVIINGVTVSYTTAEDASAGDADATVIVSNLVTAINGAGGAAASCVATAVGSGIHVTLVTSLRVSGGPQENAIYAFTDKISELSLLPLQCKHDYKVKIINSTNIDADDMWVQFEAAASDYTSGPGAWVESNEPGISYKIDPATMPHQLVRDEDDGSFAYSAIEWEQRDVGDDVTNPKPTFIGNTIRNMFFFRNRFGFLSGGSVIMSKAGSFYDFWAGSAMVAADDDPIDITASSTKPVFLNYVKTTSAGLVLFSDTEQFLLSTDSDILSPESAKVNTLSDYECDTNIPAINLGTSIAFVSKTPLYARLFELANISTTDPPTSFNTTGIVPELVPSTVDNVAGSPGMSMVSLGQTGTNTLYQYRFYQTAEKRIASTWYKWNLTGTLIDQFFDTSTFYTVISDGTNVSVVSFDLRQASDTGFLTLPTGEKTDVCMDMWNSNPYRTYDTTTGKTRIFLPFTHHTGKTLAVVALGGYIGGTLGATEASVGAILYPTVEGSAPSEYVDIDGDYRGKNIIIGYIYTMTVDLPKLYYSVGGGGDAQGRNDFTSDLIIHRIKVSTGLSGPVKYNVNLTGIPDRSQTISAIQPYTYTANDVAMSAESVHEVPIFQRNENISLSIVGDTPLPVSLLGMTWEGKYNTKFYNRV